MIMIFISHMKEERIHQKKNKTTCSLADGHSKLGGRRRGQRAQELGQEILRQALDIRLQKRLEQRRLVFVVGVHQCKGDPAGHHILLAE